MKSFTEGTVKITDPEKENVVRSKKHSRSSGIAAPSTHHKIDLEPAVIKEENRTPEDSETDRASSDTNERDGVIKKKEKDKEKNKEKNKKKSNNTAKVKRRFGFGKLLPKTSWRPNDIIGGHGVQTQKVNLAKTSRSEHDILSVVKSKESFTENVVDKEEPPVKNMESKHVVAEDDALRVEEVDDKLRVDEVDDKLRVDDLDDKLRVEEVDSILRVEESDTSRVKQCDAYSIATEQDDRYRVKEEEVKEREAKEGEVVSELDGDTEGLSTQKAKGGTEKISLITQTYSIRTADITDDGDTKNMKLFIDGVKYSLVKVETSGLTQEGDKYKVNDRSNDGSYSDSYYSDSYYSGSDCSWDNSDSSYIDDYSLGETKRASPSVLSYIEREEFSGDMDEDSNVNSRALPPRSRSPRSRSPRSRSSSRNRSSSISSKKEEVKRVPPAESNPNIITSFDSAEEVEVLFDEHHDYVVFEGRHGVLVSVSVDERQ